MCDYGWVPVVFSEPTMSFITFCFVLFFFSFASVAWFAIAICLGFFGFDLLSRQPVCLFCLLMNTYIGIRIRFGFDLKDENGMRYGILDVTDVQYCRVGCVNRNKCLEHTLRPICGDCDAHRVVFLV